MQKNHNIPNFLHHEDKRLNHFLHHALKHDDHSVDDDQLCQRLIFKRGEGDSLLGIPESIIWRLVLLEILDPVKADLSAVSPP